MRKVALLFAGDGDSMVSWAAARDWAMAAPPNMPRAPGGCLDSYQWGLGGYLDMTYHNGLALL